MVNLAASCARIYFVGLVCVLLHAILYNFRHVALKSAHPKPRYGMAFGDQLLAQ
ncbi:hypothetical protein GQ53DRAFT_745909 [Thozetella sp. PMI_491]|nr:hypothetical protein GQ53DRAFT_745909 [Thozetella sp. PMI_491]